MPRNLIDVDWFRAIATFNPVTYMIEAMRSLITTGWDGRALGLGLLAIGAIATLGFGGAAAALRTRLART
jgi:ABC-2 type transport system permease protein